MSRLLFLGFQLVAFLFVPPSLAAQTAPRISDAEFFGKLDLKRPGLEQVDAAVQQQDWPAARAAFGTYFKQRQTPRWLVMQTAPPAVPEERPDTTFADKLLAHQWQWHSQWFELGPDIDWSSNQMTEGESATLEWNARLNRHSHFRELTDAYLATGEEKYAAEIVAQLRDWIQECPVLENESGNWPYHHAWETLNTACRAGDAWPNALYRILPSKALDGDTLVMILKSLVEHARHLDRWPTKNNWLTMESTALVVVGTLLAEFQEAETWRKHGIERLYGQIQKDVYPDGLEIELALGYNNWVLRNFTLVMELLKLNDRGGELPQDYLARLEGMYSYQAYAVMPNGWVPGLNDSYNYMPTDLLRAGLRYFPQREDFRWQARRGKEGKPPEKTSCAFPYSGHFVMRSGWEEEARYLLFDAGPFGSGHQHEDKLHLIAYAYGQLLVLDGGQYTYDKSRWRRYVRSTRGHNTIRIDGEDQNRREDRESWILPMPFAPLDNTWVSEERFDLAVGRYDLGYGPERKVRVAHTRAVVFVKPDYWVLVDTLQPQDDAEHRYESLLHLNAEEAKTDAVTGSVLTQNADAANLLVWPVGGEGLNVEIVKGREEEPVQGWANSPWRPVPTAVCTLSGKGRQQLLTVLYPLPPGQPSPIDLVRRMAVTTDGREAADAVACEIRFRDGRVDRLMVAEQAGTMRRYGDVETTATMYGSSVAGDRSVSFQYPK